MRESWTDWLPCHGDTVLTTQRRAQAEAIAVHRRVHADEAALRSEQAAGWAGLPCAVQLLTEGLCS